ncbi:hypothetical protein AB0D94_31860 [Streptomyces sp. NPDC048255]
MDHDVAALVEGPRGISRILPTVAAVAAVAAVSVVVAHLSAKGHEA